MTRKSNINIRTPTLTLLVSILVKIFFCLGFIFVVGLRAGKKKHKKNPMVSREKVNEIEDKIKKAEAKVVTAEDKIAAAEAEAEEWNILKKAAIKEGKSSGEKAEIDGERAAAERKRDAAQRDRDAAILELKQWNEHFAEMFKHVNEIQKVEKTSSSGFAHAMVNEFNNKQRAHALEKPSEKKTRTLDDDCYKLTTHLFDDPNTPDKLYIRECYREYHQKVTSLLDKGNTVLIAGTRGCGKSSFGMMMALEMMDEKHVVLYEHKDELLLMFGDSFHQNELERVNKTLEIHKYTPITQPGVYRFASPQKHIYDDITQYPIMTHVLDLGETNFGVIDRKSHCRRLIISSPSSSKLRTLHNLSGLEILYMPLWSEEELWEAAQIGYPNLTKEHVEIQYQKYGGVVRHVLQNPPAVTERVFLTQIAQLSIQDLKSIMCQAAYWDLPASKNTDMLIHVKPRDGNPSNFDCDFATPLVGRLLADKYVYQSDFEAHSFFASVGQQPALAAFRGYVLEALTHRQFTFEEKYQGKDQHTAESTLLGGDGTLHEVNNVFIGKRIMFGTFPASFTPNSYYQPEAANYPTIDSFTIFDREGVKKFFGENCPVLANSTAQYFIIFFQVTVSEKHVVDGETLNSSRKDVKEAMKLVDLPMIFVFVTGKTKGIKTIQTVTHKVKDEKKEDEEKGAGGRKKPTPRKSVPYQDQKQFQPQYALYLHSHFEEFMKQWGA